MFLEYTGADKLVVVWATLRGYPPCPLPKWTHTEHAAFLGARPFLVGGSVGLGMLSLLQERPNPLQRVMRVLAPVGQLTIAIYLLHGAFITVYFEQEYGSTQLRLWTTYSLSVSMYLQSALWGLALLVLLLNRAAAHQNQTTTIPGILVPMALNMA